MKSFVLILILAFSSVVSLNNRRQCHDTYSGSPKVDLPVPSIGCLTSPTPKKTMATVSHFSGIFEFEAALAYIDDSLTDRSPIGALDGLSPNKNTTKRTTLLTSIKTLLKNEDNIWFTLMNFYRQKLISVLKKHKKPESCTFKGDSGPPPPEACVRLLSASSSPASQNIYHTIK